MSDLVLALDQAVAFLQPLGGNGVDSTQGVVDCGEHKLIVHKFPFGYLCVLSLASVQTDPLNEEILRIANELLLDGNDVETLRPPVLAPYGDEDPATLPLFT